MDQFIILPMKGKGAIISLHTDAVHISSEHFTPGYFEYVAKKCTFVPGRWIPALQYWETWNLGVLEMNSFGTQGKGSIGWNIRTVEERMRSRGISVARYV